MNDAERYLASVIASPDDDRPRIEFADWLEQNGARERAELIRIQCSLHSGSLTDIPRLELEQRLQQILDEYGCEWAEDLREDVSEWVFERGFIERVHTCLERPTDEILSVFRRAPIRHVRDTSQLCDLSGFVQALPHLGRLTGLEFWGLYAFEDDLVREMLLSPHLSNLKTLVLHHDRNGNLVDEQVIVDGLYSPHRANIEELAVNVDGDWQGPSNRIIEAIADSPYLRKLRRLNLSSAGDTGNNPQLSVETVQQLAASRNLKHLEELDLRATYAKAEVWEAILEMPQLPHLRVLRLCDACEVTTPWIPIVGVLGEMSRWRTAFDERVPSVDWNERYFDPYCGGVWKGLTWE